MKNLKNIIILYSVVGCLLFSTCYGAELKDTSFTNEKSNCIKTYYVTESEKNDFLKKLDNKITIDDNDYEFEKYTVDGGNKTDTINISTSKTIKSNTKNKNELIQKLGSSISYTKDGYVGKYKLNTDSMQITTHENGYKEKLIEKTINYTNLSKNDLESISKQITYNGRKLDLLKVDWIPESTKNIGKSSVNDKYTAKCYYATKVRINNPPTYTVTAKYTGTATKTIKNPLVVKVNYKLIPKVQETVAPAKEKPKSNIAPIVTGTTSSITIVLILLYFFSQNVTVYNFENGNYKKVGKVKLRNNTTVDLSKFALREQTNKYKLVFSKRLTSKLNGKRIKIRKNNFTSQVVVNASKNNFEAEIKI